MPYDSDADEAEFQRLFRLLQAGKPKNDHPNDE
jgi:hypothetical protein